MWCYTSSAPQPQALRAIIPKDDAVVHSAASVFGLSASRSDGG